MKNFLASFVNTNGVAFPATAAVNSSGGGATDGTEFVKIMVDDIWGWMQSLLNYTDDTPNGNSEVGASQLLTSLQKISSYITELSSNTTHTVEEWNKFSVLVLSSGCTIARLVGGTGADETNKVLVQNNNTVTVEIDFGAAVDQEEIIMQPNQWIEFVYDSETTKFIFQKSNMQCIFNITANYTIGDWVPSCSKILVSPNSSTQKGIITVTLSTMADNIGKWYDIEHKTGQGLVMIDGEGAETLMFKGSAISTALIYSAGMGYRVSNNGSNWIMKGTNLLKLGWQGRSDWTNVHMGNGVTYDNGSGTSTKNTDWTGMVVTEATSNFTGVVVEDTGGTGTTGILYIYELSSSFTFWTNDRKLTASNGQTIDINEGSGTSKNIDYNLFHNFGVNRDLIYYNILVNSTASYTNSIDVGYGAVTSSDHGFTFYNLDSNSLQIQTAETGGLVYIGSSGVSVGVDNEDWFNNISLNFSC